MFRVVGQVSVRVTPSIRWIALVTDSPRVIKSAATTLAIMSYGPVISSADSTPSVLLRAAATRPTAPMSVCMRTNALIN